MAPSVSIKTFVLSTRWGLPGPATSSSAPPTTSTEIIARMTLVTLTDRISLTV